MNLLTRAIYDLELTRKQTDMAVDSQEAETDVSHSGLQKIQGIRISKEYIEKSLEHGPGR